MNELLTSCIKQLATGGVILYPTEAVYGLGCDPFNEAAVKRLLAIKHRHTAQGLILIAAHWKQVIQLTLPLDQEKLKPAFDSWPGHTTWLFPATDIVPDWIRGESSCVALRITAHPIAKQLCESFGGPIVSTSANLHGEAASRHLVDISEHILSEVDCIHDGEVGPFERPSVIKSISDHRIIRN